MVTEYNGWPNYETWRVALELEQPLTEWATAYLDQYDGPMELLVGSCAGHVQEETYAWVESVMPDQLPTGWAFGFLGEVQWRPIVTSLCEGHPRIVEFEKEVLAYTRQKTTNDV